MEFKRAIPDHAPQIEKIEQESFADPWSSYDIMSIICKESGMSFVALDEGEVVAYLFGCFIPPEGEIYRIAVRGDKRQRGIGYRLLSYAYKTEYGRGLESLFLEVRSKNTAARALYKSFGFEEFGVRKGYYKNPDDDAILMCYGKKF